MLRFLDRMIGQLGLGCAMVLALAFATPTLASHVCADSLACSPSAVAAPVAVVEAPLDANAGCPDCGPACAGGCCHAPHAATAPALDAPSSQKSVAGIASWLRQTAPPMIRPAGPDRPPRP